MANIVITTTTNSVKIVFNTQNYYGINCETIAKTHVVEVECFDNLVEMVLDDGHRLAFTDDTGETDPTIGIVDTVTGDAPTDLEDLYDLISAIIE